MAADRSVVSAVAVCLSGWLGRALPGGGASVRTHVIDELNADAFLAATYDVGDCPFGGSECLMANVAGLRPFTAVSMERMISLDGLRTMVRRWPRFADVKVAYNFSWFGLTPFAPVLGNPRVSILRQLHDYFRVFQLVVLEEKRRSATFRYDWTYDWMIHARVDMMWLAPHVPLALLDPRLLWVPPRSGDGVSDRHAVVPRHLADVYFRQRWQLLQQQDLLEILPIESLTSDDPEHYLENVLIARGVPLGAFPIPAYIGCCAAHERCFQTACRHAVMSRWLDCPALQRRLMLNRAEAGSVAEAEVVANGTTLQTDIDVSIGSTGRSKQGIAPPGWGRVLVRDGGGSGCLATGKSVGELMEGVNNFRWLQCRGATLLPSHPSAPFERPSSAVQQSPAAWVRHYGRVGPQKSGWNLWQGKVMIAVPRTQNQTFTGSPPQSGVERWWNSALQSLLVGFMPRDRSASQLEVPDARHPRKDLWSLQWALDRQKPAHGSRHKPKTMTSESSAAAADKWSKAATRISSKSSAAARTGIGGKADILSAKSSRAIDVPAAWQVDPSTCPLLEPPLWPGSRRYGPSFPFKPWRPSTSAMTPAQKQQRIGFCDVTGEGDPGDCEGGETGSWGLGPPFAERRITSLQECARACYQYCPRCRYVSFSVKNSDCGWFHRCDLSNLRRDTGPSNGDTYRSVAVRRHEERNYS